MAERKEWKMYVFVCITNRGSRYEFTQTLRTDLDALEFARSWERNSGDRVEAFYPMDEVR